MAKISLDGLDAMQYDVLKEIGNIGAGNATTALSKMLSIKMDMSVPNVALLPFQDISSVIGSEDQRDVTTDEDLGAESFTEIEMSALNEIGNIVSGSYLNALSSLTNLKMICTVPSLTVDMVGALLSVPAAEFGKYGDKLLMIQSEFGEMDFVTGYFLLIPELDSYDKILASLGM